MKYVPYGNLLTIDQANVVYMAADAKQRKVKKMAYDSVYCVVNWFNCATF